MSLQPIIVNNKELSLERYRSSLKTDYASGVSSITVYSISQFAINQVLCIGEFGSEGSEIIKTHSATAPTGFTVTLAANTAKAHPKDTPVYILSFDQVEFSHADTLTGAKSVLGSVTDISPELDTMVYEDTTNTSGYYFTRYKNSITSVFSDYSDGVPYTGLPANTVGYAIDTAMNELGAKFSEKLTYGMLLSFTEQMLRIVRGKLKVWSNFQEFNYNFGTLSQGTRRFVMPTTIYDANSNRSMLSLRAGSDTPLTYIDRTEYLQATEGAKYTEVATEALAGATSLVLDDTSDLDDTGSVDVFVSGTKYTIDYTANTRSTNTLTVDSAEITATLPVDSAVWQDEEEGQPAYYSIWDGYVYVWPLADSTYEGRNLTGDFYTDIVSVDSDMDVIYGPRFDMLIQFLKFKIRAIIENNGLEDLKDPAYQQFREIMQDAIRLEESGQINAFRPRGNAIYGGRARGRR